MRDGGGMGVVLGLLCDAQQWFTFGTMIGLARYPSIFL
jgi:hypothetical protein